MRLSPWKVFAGCKVVGVVGSQAGGSQAGGRSTWFLHPPTHTPPHPTNKQTKSQPCQAIFAWDCLSFPIWCNTHWCLQEA